MKTARGNTRDFGKGGAGGEDPGLILPLFREGVRGQADKMPALKINLRKYH